jgi:glycosyltransferase involved in cell wall biosynthesis
VGEGIGKSRVAVIGIRKPAYPRSESIIQGLERLGFEVHHLPLPRHAGTWRRLLVLMGHVPALPQVDWIFVPHSNQLVASVIWLAASVMRKPILIDYMIGLTDGFEDRGYPSLWKYHIGRLVDRFNVARMDSLTDTQAHRQAFKRLLGVDLSRMHVLPIAAREGVAELPLPMSAPLVIQWVGTYIPFQGVEVILRAAERLRDRDDLLFELIGDGQAFNASYTLAQRLDLPNVRLVRGSFAFSQLETMVVRSSIMLGVFGDAEKTRYVIPNKILDALTWGRPLITAASPALYEFLMPGEHLITVPPGDPDALAAAIADLAAQPEQRVKLAQAGRQYVLRNLSGDAQLGRLKTIVEGVLCRSLS